MHQSYMKIHCFPFALLCITEFEKDVVFSHLKCPFNGNFDVRINFSRDNSDVFEEELRISFHFKLFYNTQTKLEW